MKDYFISFAPMEGITGRIFRKTFARHFKGVTDYYTPFITPKEKRGLDKKDLKELIPENNKGLSIVPQILTNSSEGFNLTAKKLIELGYEEININLGCPSGTVVNKGRGAGALKNLDSLCKLLDGIYNESVKNGLRVSVKTRIGYSEADEFREILSVYKKFPLAKLIIHPRTRMEFYKGRVHKESFSLAVREYTEIGAVERLCFNGELNNVSDIKSLANEFSNIKHIMIGRGLLRNPFLAEDMIVVNNIDRNKRLRMYLDDLFSEYLEEFNGSSTAILKMKELWFYVKESFEDSEHFLKDIKKAKGVLEYRAAVNVLFSNCDVKQA